MARYVSVSDLAERYGVGPATIWRWARAGIIPAPVRMSAKCTRWDLDAIERAESKRRARAQNHAAAVPA